MSKNKKHFAKVHKGRKILGRTLYRTLQKCNEIRVLYQRAYFVFETVVRTYGASVRVTSSGLLYWVNMGVSRILL